MMLTVSPGATVLNQAAANGTRIFINHVVLCEFVWMLDRRSARPRAG